MKILRGILCVVTAMNLTVLAQNIDNPPIQVECVTNWCEVVRGPGGTITYTNIYVWPGTNVCVGTEICAWPEMNWQCDTNVVIRWRWAPETTNCPPQLYTNTVCPYFLTNWWVVSHPGYSSSGEGWGVCFTPTNCGSGTITLYGVWTNTHPCGYSNAVLGGTTSISINFRVVNVDIAETEKKVCACDATGFTLTNSCGEAVTWEVVTNGLPGEPYVSGNAIVAGTNCGTWTVIARSTTNTNCSDSATLTVVGVFGITPEVGMLLTNFPMLTYAISYCPSNFLTVYASSCPWPPMEETNLPSCWQMSGGLPYTNADGTVSRTKRLVDRGAVGSTVVTAVAGCSSKSVKIIVYQATFKIFSAPGNCADEYGHAWWELSVEPQDLYPFLKSLDGIVLSPWLGTGGYYGDGSVWCVLQGCNGELRQPDNGIEPNVSPWWCISLSGLKDALQHVRQLDADGGTYHLFYHNCVHEAIAVGSAAGVSIGYSGYTPCGLAEYLVGLPSPACECQCDQ